MTKGPVRFKQIPFQFYLKSRRNQNVQHLSQVDSPSAATADQQFLNIPSSFTYVADRCISELVNANSII